MNLFDFPEVKQPECDWGGVARDLAEQFDVDLSRVARPFRPFDLRSVVEEPFSLGVVVGPSGSGKSQALRLVGGDAMANMVWDGRLCVADHFESADDARLFLGAAGLNSVPQWLKPWWSLSTGEQYRASFARVLAEARKPLVVVDEFTSVVDRTVARSLCESLRRALPSMKRPLVLATCHFDVLDWLDPDWVLFTAEDRVERRGRSHRPPWKVHLFGQVGAIRRG